MQVKSHELIKDSFDLADFAAIGLLCSRWASLKQHAFYISVLTCYSPLSSTLTNALSGIVSLFIKTKAFNSDLRVLAWMALYLLLPCSGRAFTIQLLVLHVQ
jgi:hypothetical protein